MLNTSIALRTARRLAGSAAVLVALAGATSATATPLPANGAPTPTVNPAPAAQTQGIIMRDGGICDPIRHMGC